MVPHKETSVGRSPRMERYARHRTCDVARHVRYHVLHNSLHHVSLFLKLRYPPLSLITSWSSVVSISQFTDTRVMPCHTTLMPCPSLELRSPRESLSLHERGLHELHDPPPALHLLFPSVFLYCCVYPTCTFISRTTCSASRVASSTYTD